MPSQEVSTEAQILVVLKSIILTELKLDVDQRQIDFEICFWTVDKNLISHKKPLGNPVNLNTEDKSESEEEFMSDSSEDEVSLN